MQRTIDLYLLSQYFKNECTIEEKSVVENWANKSDSNKQMLNEALKIWKNDHKIKQLNMWFPFIIERLKQLN